MNLKEFEGSSNRSLERTHKVMENPIKENKLDLEYAEDNLEEVVKDLEVIT